LLNDAVQKALLIVLRIKRLATKSHKVLHGPSNHEATHVHRPQPRPKGAPDAGMTGICLMVDVL
jgi:hypothetical protein